MFSNHFRLLQYLPSTHKAIAHRPLNTTSNNVITQYWNTMYPIQLGPFGMMTSYFPKLDTARLTARVESLIPNDLRDAGVTVLDVDPRFKDGGAFVTLKLPNDLTSPELVTSGINKHLRALGLSRALRFFYLFGYGSVSLMRGAKFNEDITLLTPSNRIKVDMSDALSLESIYEVFRPFGHINDIRFVSPKEVVIHFKYLRSATSARNCTYNLIYGDKNVVLRSSYEKLLKTHTIINWMSSHPRIVVPFLVALLVTLGVAIFDPIHVYMVESKLLNRFRFNLSSWFPTSSSYFPGLVESGMKSLSSTFGGPPHKFPASNGLELDDFNGGDAQLPRLQSLMYESPESLIVITGPTRVGKSQLAHAVASLPNHPDAPKIIIDCEAFVAAHTDADVIRFVAQQLGYWPLLYSANKLTTYIDMALTATTGAKTSISVSDDSLLKNMLDCASVALAEVAKHRGPNDPYPIIVLDNFLKDKPSKTSYSSFYESLAQWAGFLVESGIAQVIVVASSGQRGGGEVGVMQALGKALPTKTVDVVTLTDMSLEQAEKYLELHLNAAASIPEKESTEIHKPVHQVSSADLKQIVDQVGGRATDLGLMVHKLVDGKSVNAALNEMITKSILEIHKNGLTGTGAWSPAQFWYVIRQIVASEGSVSFDKIRHSTLFSGSDKPLFDMERAELVSVQYDSARPRTIKLNKPLFSTAVQRILADAKLCAGLDVVMYKDLYKAETNKVKAYQDEYTQLAEAAGRLARTSRGLDKALDDRMKHLAQVIGISQKKVAEWWDLLAEAKSKL